MHPEYLLVKFGNNRYFCITLFLLKVSENKNYKKDPVGTSENSAFFEEIRKF